MREKTIAHAEGYELCKQPFQVHCISCSLMLRVALRRIPNVQKRAIPLTAACCAAVNEGLRHQREECGRVEEYYCDQIHIGITDDDDDEESRKNRYRNLS